MIIDLRTYTYLPSKYRKFLKGYEEIGFHLTSKHLGTTLGIFRPESGVQNRTFQFFMYEDSPHRDVCRRGMLADPAWGEFVKMDSDALLQQMNTLIVPAAFSAFQTSAQAPKARGEASRLFELRTWICAPAATGETLEALASGDADAIGRKSGEVIGWFTAETGADHRIILLSAYADAAARDAMRANLQKDTAATAALAALRANVRKEEAQLLLAMPYSPLR